MSEAVKAAFNKKKVGAFYVITNFLCGHSFQALECTPQHLPLGGVPLRPEREEWHRPPQLPPLPRLHGSLVRGEEEPQTFTDCLHMMSQWSTPLISVMPGMQILLFLMNLVNIACNFYLYRFLEEKRRNNTGASKGEQS